MANLKLAYEQKKLIRYVIRVHCVSSLCPVN